MRTSDHTLIYDRLARAEHTLDTLPSLIAVLRFEVIKHVRTKHFLQG